MTQTNNIKNVIRKKLKEIENNLNAYENVNGTLSEKTLINVANHLILANNKLEEGFVNDSCEEIEKRFNIN